MLSETIIINCTWKNKSFWVPKLYTVRYRESLIYVHKITPSACFYYYLWFFLFKSWWVCPFVLSIASCTNFASFRTLLCSVRGIDTLLVTPPRLALYIGFDKYTRRQRSSFPSEEKAGHASPIAEFAFYFSWRGARRRRFSWADLAHTYALCCKSSLAKTHAKCHSFTSQSNPSVSKIKKKDKGNERDMTRLSIST